MNKGFGLIGLLITILTIGLLVYGGWYLSRGQKQNQIQQAQTEVDSAKNAANQENQYNIDLQNQVQSQGDNVNYHSIQDKLK